MRRRWIRKRLVFQAVAGQLRKRIDLPIRRFIREENRDRWLLHTYGRPSMFRR